MRVNAAVQPVIVGVKELAEMVGLNSEELKKVRYSRIINRYRTQPRRLWRQGSKALDKLVEELKKQGREGAG